MSIGVLTLAQTTTIQQQQALLLGEAQALQFLLSAGLTPAALQAWYSAEGNAPRFTAVLQSALGVEILLANPTTFTAILGSASALAAFIANANALHRTLSNRNSMLALFSSANAKTALIANATALAQIRALAPAGAPRSVPTMTNETAPEGEAAASSIYDANRLAWKVFDKSTSGEWRPTAGMMGWVSYMFTAPVWVHTVTLLTGPSTDGVRNFAIDSSTDNWATSVEEFTATAAAVSKLQTFHLAASRQAKWWRLRLISNGGGASTSVTELDFKGIA